MAPTIILYGYPGSPYYQKVFQALTFLNLPFKTCLQPPMLPRPDFTSVGITYRRIPILSIDNEVYADTTLIINKLCKLAGVENDRKYEFFGKETFSIGVGLLPAKFLQDEKFIKDRTDFSGKPFNAKTMSIYRPATLSQFLSLLNILETELLAHSDFVAGPKMTIADVHAGFAVLWVLLGHRGCEPECNKDLFPKIYSWLNRMIQANPPRNVEKITWENAKKIILSSSPQLQEISHNAADPSGLQVGQAVSIIPTDTGRSHPQIGELVAANLEEICIRIPSSGLRIHFPRIGFVVQKVKANL